ncbi:unnamed protein product [Brachionus calyciflorus]|uniref:RPB6 homolog n=1 Tax=Brachionus calyciflorus TaxID=104777 RepID=A0A814DEZ3_9BILA|nr:unnamed protein product [Brachionus calyciflorus]
MADDEGFDDFQEEEEEFNEEDQEVLDDLAEYEAEAVEILAQDQVSHMITREKRITTPYMTKYERARVLGTRALQISMCAPIMVELEHETDPLEIAKKELKEKKIPFIIQRQLPDGSCELWPVQELIITD